MNASESDAGPGAGAVEGPAYPLAARALAALILLLLLAAGLRSLASGAWGGLEAGHWAYVAAIVGVAGLGFWRVQAARTAIDATAIRQIGPGGQCVALADIAQLKLVRLPGLAWLVVPRLVVRARGHIGVVVFRAGDRQLLAAFRRLAYGEVPAA